MKADWKKSVWKALKLALLVMVGHQVPLDQWVTVLPKEVADVTVAGVLASLLNFVKVQFGLKFVP